MRNSTQFLIVFGALFLTVGCSDGGPGRAADGLPVVVTKVVKKDMPVQLSAVGVVEPSLSVVITALVGGSLKEVHFNAGQEVHKGDPLYTIDPAPFEARVREAEANLARSRAEAANAEAQRKRYESLVSKEYITKEQFDQSNAAALGTRATVRAAEATLENAQLELSYTAIRAPLSGRTGDVLVKPGNIVKANEISAPLTTIKQLRPTYVRFSVAEQYLASIRQEQAKSALEVQARLKGETTQRVSGRLSFVDNTVDRSTGMILLKATFENEDEKLWPGQFVDVMLVLRVARDALIVPSEAVQTGQQGPYVWIVKSDLSAEVRKVTQAFSVGEESVIATGLSEGEQIVIDGQLRLASGSQVQIKESR